MPFKKEKKMPTKIFLGAFYSNFLGSIPPFPVLEHKVLPSLEQKIRIPPPADLFSTPLLPPTTVPKYVTKKWLKRASKCKKLPIFKNGCDRRPCLSLSLLVRVDSAPGE